MQKEKDWFKRRNYLHLSPKIHTSQEVKLAKAKIQNPQFVARYAFYPLIHRTDTQRRYKKLVDEKGEFIINESGKVKRSHYDKNKQKSQAKNRPIEYATHFDMNIYDYYKKVVLNPLYEAILEQHSELNKSITAYRSIPTDDGLRNKGNIDFAKEVFDYVKSRGNCSVLTFDIENFFPSIHHQILKEKWSDLLKKSKLPPDHYAVFKSITKYSYILLDDLRKGNGFDEKKIAQNRKKGVEAFFESPKEFREIIKNGELRIYQNKTGKGIPHGLPISSFLANLYLLDFDKAIVEKLKSWGGYYRRYSDDIILVCDKNKIEDFQNLILKAIDALQLKISIPKSEVFLFQKNEQGILKVYKKQGEQLKPNIPLTYLGFEFYGDKVLIKNANIAKYYRRMKEGIKTTVRHAQKRAEKELKDEPLIFKRRLKRRFTHYGWKPKGEDKKSVRLVFDPSTQTFKYQVQAQTLKKRYRGNVLTYIKKASEIFETDSFEKQFEKHQTIFNQYLKEQLEKAKK